MASTGHAGAKAGGSVAPLEEASRPGLFPVSGRAAYAVISFGGFLGFGEDYYPVPWPTLKYDTDPGGYLVNLTRDQLEGAPRL